MDDKGEVLTGGRAWAGNEGGVSSSGDANLAFDGSTNTAYRTCMNPGKNHDWIAYEHASAASVSRIIVRQWGSAGNHIKAFDLEGSDDGIHWNSFLVTKDLPVSEFDSARDKASIESSIETPNPDSVPRVATFTLPPAPITHPSSVDGLEIREVFNYQPNIGGGPHVTVWMGSRIALVVCKGVAKEFDPTDAHAMAKIVKNLERMLSVYDNVMGRIPLLVNPFCGRVRYEIAYINASGLASHGVAGIATGPAFIKGMYEAALRGAEYIHHVFFYETMRNYIFPEVFTPVVDYCLESHADCWGWVNQGFVNCVGCLLSEHIPIAFEYYGADREGFMKSMESHLDQYLGSPDVYNWQNTWNKERLPWAAHQSLDNLFSGLLVRLYRQYGGVDFLIRWFRNMPSLLHRAPKTKSDQQGARDNIFILSSISARKNLKSFFRDDLRWQISDNAIDYLELIEASNWGE